MWCSAGLGHPCLTLSTTHAESVQTSLSRSGTSNTAEQAENIVKNVFINYSTLTGILHGLKVKIKKKILNFRN